MDGAELVGMGLGGAESVGTGLGGTAPGGKVAGGDGAVGKMVLTGTVGVPGAALPVVRRNALRGPRLGGG